MTVLPLFYVYTLSYPDGRVFYVGKGKGNRTEGHKYQARHGHNCHKCNTIRSIWAAGQQVKVDRTFETTDEQAAFEIERQTIAQWGRDNLTNQTDGGEGSSGWNPSETWRIKKSISTSKQNAGNRIWSGKKHNPETLKKMSEHNAMRNPKYRHRVSLGLIGRLVSDETRRKMSESAKKRGISFATREKIRETMLHKPRIVSDETRKKLSEKLKGRTFSSETIERMSESARERNRTRKRDKNGRYY